MLPPKGVYLPISKLHSILALVNLLAHNNISQISLQSAAVNCSFCDNLTPLGVTFILLAMVPQSWSVWQGRWRRSVSGSGRRWLGCRWSAPAGWRLWWAGPWSGSPPPWWAAGGCWSPPTVSSGRCTGHRAPRQQPAAGTGLLAPARGPEMGFSDNLSDSWSCKTYFISSTLLFSYF